MSKCLTSIDLEKVKTKISTDEIIWVGDLFNNGSNLVRQITLIRNEDMRLCRTREEQQGRIDQALKEGQKRPFPNVINFKQYKVDGNGFVVEKKPVYRSCYVKAFMRWVNNPPKAKTEKCQHCNGTGRVPHEEV